MTVAPVTLPEKNFAVNRLIWSAIAAVLLADALLTSYEGMTVYIGGATPMLYSAAGCIAIGILFCYVKRDDVLCLFGNTIAQMIAMGVVLGLLNHLTVRFALPLMDKTFLAIDRFLHFDWLAYIGWVNARPDTALLFTLFYQSYNVQGIVLICLLFIYKNADHAQRVIIISFFSALSCILIGAFFPAMGLYSMMHIDLAQYPHLHPTEALIHIRAMNDIRDATSHRISFPTGGAVMFPSFHAAMAVFLIYASLPFRWLRWFVIALNIAMLFSIPVDGGHYLIDIPAGLALALLGVVIAKKIVP